MDSRTEYVLFVCLFVCFPFYCYLFVCVCLYQKSRIIEYLFRCLGVAKFKFPRVYLFLLICTFATSPIIPESVKYSLCSTVSYTRQPRGSKWELLMGRGHKMKDYLVKNPCTVNISSSDSMGIIAIARNPISTPKTFPRYVFDPV